MQIDARIRHEVLAINPAEKTLRVCDLNAGVEFMERYDQLLIATGARPIRPDIDGIDSVNVHDVNTLANGTLLRQTIDSIRPQHAVIVGAGYIGIEVAEALHLRGIKTTLVQRGPRPMSMLDDELGDDLAKILVESGLDLRLNERLEGFVTHNGKVTEVLTESSRIKTDLVVLGLGVLPESRIADACGIELGPKGSIAVDQHQQTSYADIWAAGDCAQSMHLVSGKPVHVAMGTVANKQGRVAGMNIAGTEARFPGVVGTAITKYLQTEISKTGLGEDEISALALESVSVTVEGSTLPRYYPGSSPMKVRLHAEKGTARFLGAQIIGGQGSAKRIDTAATALHAGFDLDQMLYLDLAYAPPFSGVWEPLVVAARLALKKI